MPVLTLDRILGPSLQGKRALILVDVEGAEYAVLQGAVNTLVNEPKPIWMVEIGATTHQPEGVTVNPYLLSTFEIFFRNDYEAVTADDSRAPITEVIVEKVFRKEELMPTHNFLFYQAR